MTALIPEETGPMLGQRLSSDNRSLYMWVRDHFHNGVFLRTPYVRVRNSDEIWLPDEQLSIIWLKGVVVKQFTPP
jgi:hypothetical protein